MSCKTGKINVPASLLSHVHLILMTSQQPKRVELIFCLGNVFLEGIFHFTSFLGLSPQYADILSVSLFRNCEHRLCLSK